MSGGLPDLIPGEVTIAPRSLWWPMPWIAGSIGALGAIAAAVLGWGTSELYFAWLVAYLYFLSIALGGLFFVLVLYASKAGWGVVVRRVAEDAMATLPLFAVLFVPIWLGRGALFEWTHSEVVAADAVLQGKRGYLNADFFLWRAILYFVIWTAIALWYARQSRRQDRTGAHAITRRLQAAAGPALIVFALTTSFAAFDWIMSLDPHWYSTMFGVYYFSGTTVAIFAFTAVVLIALRGSGLLRNVVGPEHFHDLGKLLFAFTVFWAYIAFSQYLLIWYGNIPEETVWYLERLRGSWKAISVLLAVGHFAVPFFFLMPRTIKRKPGLLLAGALWMLAMHLVDLYWCVMPVLHHHGFHVGAIDVAAFVAVGGLFFGTFAWQLRGRALIPVKDPRLPESVAYENV